MGVSSRREGVEGEWAQATLKLENEKICCCLVKYIKFYVHAFSAKYTVNFHARILEKALNFAFKA